MTYLRKPFAHLNKKLNKFKNTLLDVLFNEKYKIRNSLREESFKEKSKEEYESELEIVEDKIALIIEINRTLLRGMVNPSEILKIRKEIQNHDSVRKEWVESLIDNEVIWRII